ncbi:response regulator [Pseudomonas sp. NPDC086278]|uniref:response regulator n=1 Tax=Pseudomonas sp. NPDC086278 TaxID=3390646 RepID=UPI003CFF73AB
MPNKSLRILIADEQHFQRMKIERLFNQLGYYRVAPVQNLGELLTLVEYGCAPFDLVIVNASMAVGALDLRGFFLHNPQVHHALIYDGQAAQLPSTPMIDNRKVRVSHTLLPEMACIEQLMMKVDPTLAEHVQPWPRGHYQRKAG